MRPKIISESELQSRETPGDGWYIIESSGDHPAVISADDGAPVTITQHLTREVLARIAAAGVPEDGLLVDRDHLSREVDHPTEAMGWVRELALCSGNLAARIEWTQPGQRAIAGKIYKHFSTVYPAPTPEDVVSGTYSPTKLVELALTNRPNNAGAPAITNSSYPRSRRIAGSLANTQQTNPIPNMTYPIELLTLLGLPEGATDAEVLDAVQALKAGSDAAAESEAEAVVNSVDAEEGATLSDDERRECKNAVLSNREQGLKYTRYMARCKALSQRSGAPTRRYAGNNCAISPLPRSGGDARERAICNRASAIVQSARERGISVNYWTALARARQEAKSSPLS